ncbi:MAG: zinc-ribbon domain-containing protein [Myxococcales bacterium]|nr:zinc-ribbon domain-containing protein [Myxococcales bacterium]
MKIECNHCGTAYSVADSKIAGRKLKLRCKKCSEPIRVDGSTIASEADAQAEGAAAAESEVAMATVPPPAPQMPAPAMPPPEMPEPQAVGAPQAAPDAFEPPVMAPEPQDGAAWHISVGETTQGPYTIEELGEYYAQGSILLDTLVFRDGWTDWVPAGEIAEITGAAQAEPAALPPVPAVGAQTLQEGVGMGDDPFAEQSAAPSPRISAEQIMGGPQTEGTVQFSLDEIRAISAVSLPAVPPPVPQQDRPGFASGEQSGLIDVAALAAMEPAQDNGGRSDSLIHAQASPLDSLAPMALPPLGGEQREDGALRNKLFAGVAALGLLLAAGVAALAITHSPEEPAQPVAAAAIAPEAAAAAAPEEMPTPAAAAAEEPAETEAAAAEEGEVGDLAAAMAKKPEPEAKADRPAKKRSNGKVRSKDRAKKTKSSRASSSAKKSIAIDDVLAEPKKKKSSSGSSSIDDLLDGAISGKSKPKAAPKPEPKSDLPKTPSRDDVKRAFGKITRKVKKCKGDGIAKASVKVAGSGKVTSVTVTGVSGPAKSCVEKAVRSTRFPKFSKPNFQVAFPFKL